MTTAGRHFLNPSPTPVADDDPRLADACTVADLAWLSAPAGDGYGMTNAQRMRLVVRTLLAHLDATARCTKLSVGAALRCTLPNGHDPDHGHLFDLRELPEGLTAADLIPSAECPAGGDVHTHD